MKQMKGANMKLELNINRIVFTRRESFSNGMGKLKSKLVFKRDKDRKLSKIETGERIIFTKSEERMFSEWLKL
jgi:hypothetical protein